MNRLMTRYNETIENDGCPYVTNHLICEECDASGFTKPYGWKLDCTTFEGACSECGHKNTITDTEVEIKQSIDPEYDPI